MNINFPDALIIDEQIRMLAEMNVAKQAKNKKWSSERKRRAYHGELLEQAFEDWMEANTPHKIVENIEVETNEYWWDMKVDGKTIDLKLHISDKYFPGSNYFLENLENLDYLVIYSPNLTFSGLSFLGAIDVQKHYDELIECFRPSPYTENFAYYKDLTDFFEPN